MAADFIGIIRNDNNAVFANELQTAVSQAQSLFDTISRIVAKGYHLFVDGPPVDFAAFETKYGIPPGKGQAVWDIVNGTLLAMKGEQQNAQFMVLKERVG